MLASERASGGRGGGRRGQRGCSGSSAATTLGGSSKGSRRHLARSSRSKSGGAGGGRPAYCTAPLDRPARPCARCFSSERSSPLPGNGTSTSPRSSAFGISTLLTSSAWCTRRSRACMRKHFRRPIGHACVQLMRARYAHAVRRTCTATSRMRVKSRSPTMRERENIGSFHSRSSLVACGRRGWAAVGLSPPFARSRRAGRRTAVTASAEPTFSTQSRKPNVCIAPQQRTPLCAARRHVAHACARQGRVLAGHAPF